MADVQLENGYVRIENNLFKAIYSSDLSKNELCVVLCIIRHTYGYNKKTHQLSLRFIAEDTGLKYPRISEAISRLQGKNIVIVENQGGNNPRLLSIQKDYAKWETSVTENVTRKQKKCYEKRNTSVTENVTLSVTENVTKERQIYKDKYKDNILYSSSASDDGEFAGVLSVEHDDCREAVMTKNQHDNNLPQPDLDAEFEELWQLYPRKVGRKDAKAKYVKARTRKKSPATFEQVKYGIECYAEQIRMSGTELRYVKHGSAWFNQEVWQDYDYDEDAHAKTADTEEGNKWQ